MALSNQESSGKITARDHLRFHRAHQHLMPTFGESWFALKAEAFARFFGTPFFLGAQTIIVLVWIVLNVTGVSHFDLYPFILLNLAFRLQAAYAAPLILLAQTRQAERDKAHGEADALHREDLAQANEKRLKFAAEQAEQMIKLIEMNTELTNVTKQLTERIEIITDQLHKQLIK